jgi:hypothetical protein
MRAWRGGREIITAPLPSQRGAADTRAGLPSRGTALRLLARHPTRLLARPFADDRLTVAGRKPRAFAHARQRPTMKGLTAGLLSSTYFEHRSTLLHWMHF